MFVSALDVGDLLAVRSLRLSISIISVKFGAQLNVQLSRSWHLVYKHLNDDTRCCNMLFTRRRHSRGTFIPCVLDEISKQKSSEWTLWRCVNSQAQIQQNKSTRQTGSSLESICASTERRKRHTMKMWWKNLFDSWIWRERREASRKHDEKSKTAAAEWSQLMKCFRFCRNRV